MFGIYKKMKMKKVLLSILVLALVFVTRGFSFAVETSYDALVDFTDFDPRLVHNKPRVEEVISCNMVLKPRTQAHLSRFCSSAVGNVVYYFNNSTSDVQKGPDYNVVDTGEEYILFYPATRLINNSYIGGTIKYKVGCDFQTKKTNGEKVYLEVPPTYQSAVIISSKTLYLDMGEEYTLSQPTGDQSQPNWVGTKQAYPSLSGRYMTWTFRFGALGNSVSGAFGLLKVKLKNFDVSGGVNATMIDGQISPEEAATIPGLTVVDGVIYSNCSDEQPVNEEGNLAICKRAKKFIMQYNLNPTACDENTNEVRTEDGWVEIDAEQARQYLYFDESTNVLHYPQFWNAWGRVLAVLEVPTADDCKPVRRTIVKGRIGVKYPGFEFKNMKEGDVLKIYNVNGKKIREITSGTAEGFVWDGRNDSGDWAKSGIYIYQIKVDGKLVSGTIAFVY